MRCPCISRTCILRTCLKTLPTSNNKTSICTSDESPKKCAMRILFVKTLSAHSNPQVRFRSRTILYQRHLQLLLGSRKLLVRRHVDNHQVERILQALLARTVAGSRPEEKPHPLFILRPFFHPRFPRFPMAQRFPHPR